VVRWALLAAIPLLAAAIVSLGFVLRTHGTESASATPPADTTAAATWNAGSVRAPGFALTGENGEPLSLAALRGHSVLLTFIDPLCRNLCPIEAQRLNDVVRSRTGPKPLIVAVSVNTAGNTPSILAVDRKKWGAVPQWRWAVGTQQQLTRVWHAYHIEVLATTKKVAGVAVRNVSHTEAAYLIDANGYERALFIWPYSAGAVARALDATTAS
jgi:protein SCO1/2